MAFRQVLSPNLDNDPNNPLYIWVGRQILTDWYGWCLAVVAGSYGAAGSSYSAKTAWQSCPTKHWDRNIPEYVWVPLWYEGGEYGHVVMGFRQGNGITIYSSPYTHQPTFQRFDGELNWALDYIGQVYRVGGFTGWSETVLDSRVIEWVEDQVAEPEPQPEPEKPEPEPEPIPVPDEPSEPSDEPTEPIEDEPKEDEPKEDNMSSPEPAKQYQDQQQVMSLIEDAGEGFDFPKNVKFIAYLVGDALLVASLLIPDIVNTIQATDGAIWAEYMSKVLLEGGIAILTVFKLFKKKK
jgi:hypothetical protein